MNDDNYKSLELNYSESNLPELLLYDRWHYGEAFFLFLNLDPLESFVNESAPSLNETSQFNEWARRINTNDQDEVVMIDLQLNRIPELELFCLKDSYDRFLNIWRSSHGYLDDQQEPAYFIQWAQKKRIEIPWLKWATSKRFLDQPGGELSPKAEGTARKIIRALATQVIGELTGIKHKDANALLQALASEPNAVEAPCGAETLAKWLKEQD